MIINKNVDDAKVRIRTFFKDAFVEITLSKVQRAKVESNFIRPISEIVC